MFSHINSADDLPVLPWLIPTNEAGNTAGHTLAVWRKNSGGSISIT